MLFAAHKLNKRLKKYKKNMKSNTISVLTAAGVNTHTHTIYFLLIKIFLINFINVVIKMYNSETQLRLSISLSTFQEVEKAN